MRLRRAVRPSLREAKRRGDLAASSVGPTTGPQRPRKPNDPILIVESSATRIIANRDPVVGAASYLVQCRLKGESIAEDTRLTTQASDAEINISGQGIRIVRLQACNADRRQ